MRGRAVDLAVALFVLICTLPVVGLFVTSFRDKDQIAASGWWTAFSPVEETRAFRLPDRGEETGVLLGATLTGSVLAGDGRVTGFGITPRAPVAFAPGEVARFSGGGTVTVSADGAFSVSDRSGHAGGRRIYYGARLSPRLTLGNYVTVLGAEGLGRSFLNSAAVAIPSTVIPAVIACFAAYALAWMRFPGRALLVSAVVVLMAVPLQMALIPLLTLYNSAGQAFGFEAKSYVGLWLAHTGFGLPLAIFILRNAMSALPGAMIEAARMDGAGDFVIFSRVVLPLTLPALAGFAVFQFIWTWNDLLVALVFLGPQDDTLVLTGRLLNLLGSHGGDWQLLAAGAFVSIAAPLCVFFALQRYLVRGLLAGVSR
ncbi:carbohydrate ABC transporter permease [Albidovulum sediminicola]|uniref:Carbohydrate ABC transporter permease n=1 Tax=Albidovulum sediminicola TaxID=2984331 RepID=A0ABT2Z0U8_9RHOB|nr:carbohydrate ABC transporter permease [Defluviimonas sp. WL0075]MCV2864361.1 carbohydrate ABC transporter permease [Defluviimonas sp. WL0075]